ncbi:hypothetical protein pEaSNUABM11_00166 [Erwinia phage pEa_SNUABM_11]|nr:hypothetical protein pEaSNUABM11_00166 [Erwinia phage pEa_SNUABM_11]
MALYSLSQRQFLFDAINAESPGAIAPLGLDNALIGAPKAIAVTASGANTEIIIRGRQGRGYTGAQTFRYQRLSLNDLFKNIVPQVTAPNAYGYLYTDAKKLAFAQNVNGRYGLNLEAADIPDQYIYLNVKNTLTVKSTCIQYTGAITFMSIKGKNNLEELVVNDILDELNHPSDPKLDRKCAEMLSYGLDFSDELQLMESFVNGRLDIGVNFTSGATVALLQMFAGRGLPQFDYTKTTVKRIASSADSRTNGISDKVLIISGMNDPQVAGDWLLHYNI